MLSEAPGRLSLLEGPQVLSELPPARGPHHPLLPPERLAALKLEAEDIALTAASQKHKLTVVLEAVNRSLQLEERQAKWSVESMWAATWPPRGSVGPLGSFCFRLLTHQEGVLILLPAGVQPGSPEGGRSLGQPQSGIWQSSQQPSTCLCPGGCYCSKVQPKDSKRFCGE